MVSQKAPLKFYDLTVGGRPIAEFQAGDVIPALFGGTGASSLADFAAALSAVTALSSMTDVLISSPTSAQILAWNTTKWVPSTIIFPPAGGGTSLSALADTAIGVPNTGQVLTWSSTKWAPSTVLIGTTETASNLGVAPGSSYSQKVGNDLQFRTISGINVLVSTVDASTIIVSSQTSAALTAAITSVNSQTGPAITINGASGTLVSTLNNTLTIYSPSTTTNISEGTNLYYTDERVDDRVNALLVITSGLAKSYDDAGNLLSLGANFTSAIWNASAFQDKQISGTPLTGQIYIYDGTKWVTSSRAFAYNFLIDGGAMSSGIKGSLEIPHNCTLSSVTLLADVSGYVSADIWKSSYANYPSTSSNSIVGNNPPFLASGLKYQDNTLTNWTKAISAGDILRFNLSATPITITQLTISLKGTIP